MARIEQVLKRCLVWRYEPERYSDDNDEMLKRDWLEPVASAKSRFRV